MNLGDVLNEDPETNAVRVLCFTTIQFVPPLLGRFPFHFGLRLVLFRLLLKGVYDCRPWRFSNHCIGQAQMLHSPWSGCTVLSAKIRI